MQLDVWHISGAGFHFGRHGLGQEESSEHLPSDSLFAALAARLADQRGAGAVDTFARAFQLETPPFTLTSAFPRAGAVRFFPTPLRPPLAELKRDGPRIKDLKKVKYVSEAVFRHLLDGRPLAEFAHDDKLKLHGKQIVLTHSEFSQLPNAVQQSRRLYHIERRPRVTIGRAAQNSQLYFTGRTAFERECGLWFGVQWHAPTDEMKKMLADLLVDLGDAGLGGERATGFGHCKIETQPPLTLPDPVTLWASLSRYLPQPDEVQAFTTGAAYTIETVGGWVVSPVSVSERRRTVRMLAEGAVLGKVARVAPGALVDVQPDYEGKRPLGHPVWRNGRAVAVGLKG